MHIKFSLSGGQWIAGDDADSIFSDTKSCGIPASLITTHWSDSTMSGSISISLAQISCRFEISDIDREDFISIMSDFMHENYKENHIVSELASRMRDLREKFIDVDD